jgi:hypothetical protein
MRRYSVATTALTVEFVEVVASEMALGIDRAVEGWLAQIDHALSNRQLTTLGRLNAVQDVLRKYKQLTGKMRLNSDESRFGRSVEESLGEIS